ncbi:methyl-accepting chemotaxis protein [Paenibacillus sp. CAU 1782]
MKWIYNMKISKKLTIAFILVALLAGVVGVIGIMNLKNIDRDYSNMYVDYGISIGNLGEAGILFQNNRATVRRIVMSDQSSEKQKLFSDIQKRDADISRALNAFETSIINENTRTVFLSLRNNFDQYQIIRDETINLAIAGKTAEATDELAKAQPISDEVSELLNQLFEEKQSSGLRVSGELTNQSNNTVTMMIVVVIFAIAVALMLGIFISRIISNPINKLIRVADRIAGGDLDVDIEINSKDEVGTLAAAFRKLSSNTNEALLSIQNASEQVASGAQQISETGMVLSQGAAEQASSVQQLTASLEEISNQTRINADTAVQANQLAEEARDNALQGNQQMQGMLTAMDEINTSSENISKIIKVIDEIAFQTNILALNAAVEAARAGQHGKGFAVVAEEVRNLAARSAGAAKETTDMIEGSIKKVKDGMHIAGETAAALDKIVTGITRAASLVGSITDASNEQAAGISQVNQGIIQVSQVVQTNSATSEESAAASEQLAGQAEVLKEQVGRFNLRKSSRSSGYRDLEELSPDIVRLLENMSERNRSAAHDGYPDIAADRNAGGPGRILLSDNEFGKYG